MKRKVLKVGNASLAVSLPSKWAKDHNLKSGDELEVAEKEGGLMILGHGIESVEEVTVMIGEDDPLTLIHTIISNAYKKGYDIVHVQYASLSVFLRVQKIVDGLIGYEIITHDSNSCLIKNIIHSLESEYDTFLRKTFQMTLQFSEICYEDAKNKKFSRFEEVQHLKESITKYADFVKRLTNKKRHEERTIIFDYVIIFTLEKLLNEYYYIYRYMHKQPPHAFNAKTLEYFKRTNELFRAFYDVFYSRDHYKIANVRKVKDKHIYEDLPELLHLIKGKDAVVAHHLANVARRVQDMTAPFFNIMLGK